MAALFRFWRSVVGGTRGLSLVRVVALSDNPSEECLNNSCTHTIEKIVLQVRVLKPTDPGHPGVQAAGKDDEEGKGIAFTCNNKAA